MSDCNQSEALIYIKTVPNITEMLSALLCRYISPHYISNYISDVVTIAKVLVGSLPGYVFNGLRVVLEGPLSQCTMVRANRKSSPEDIMLKNWM